MSEPILITGMGIVSAIGMNCAETLESLLKEQTGIGPLKYLKTEHKEFPVGEVKLSTQEMARRLGFPEDTPVTRTSLMGIWALKQALEQAQIGEKEQEKAAFVSGTTVGGMDMSEQFYLDFLNNDTRNQYIAQHDCGACSEAIADYFGRFASISTLSTACSSAANAIINGANLLRNGQHEIAIVGGSECITKFHLNGFNSLMILDEQQCRPFDETRAGLNLGEGAAFLVLETMSSTLRRGVHPIGVIKGYGNACDAFHQTASSPNGEGSYLAMKQALEDAGIKPEDVDYVNAHGTGTPNNDVSESQAMMRIFGEKLPPVSSTKSFTGHTTSASGSIETVICLLALQNQFVPVNLGFKHPMSDGIVPATSSIPIHPLRYILCNSFGFGGNDSSLLLAATSTVDMQTSTKTSLQVHPIYVNAAEQISIQQGLSEDWMNNPITYDEEYVRSLPIDFKKWISPGEARRLGILMKRALVTSISAMQKAGIEYPDAIITGTGLGCIENTEIFLWALCTEGEQCLKPTAFMQSTHNTISSLVSIHSQSHGYNVTYAHKDVSIDCALEDAWIQMQLGKIQTAIVNGQDEMTPKYYSLLKKTGYLGNKGQIAGETAVSIALDKESHENTLCRITDVKRIYRPTQKELAEICREMGTIDAVMTDLYDKSETKIYETLFPNTPLLCYKNLFGDGYTSYGLSIYATAHILAKRKIPSYMMLSAGPISSDKPQRIVVVNSGGHKDYTFVVMER